MRGKDTTVSAGTEANLQGNLIVPPSVDFSIVWVADSTVIASGLLNHDVVVDSTAVFGLVVTLENGCTNRDDVIVYVDPSPKVYVPNVFTPNDDDVNDQLEIFFGSDVSWVKFVEIYDRWGEMVYTIRDVSPDNPDLKWDGTLDGQPLVPGVMVYRVMVRNRSGADFLFEGSLTLMK